MNLSCVLSGGLLGVMGVSLLYYFFTEWNTN
jgi:hypothetical protein